jgi:hypothetical protein
MNGYHTSFLFRSCWVCFLAWKLTVLTGVCCSSLGFWKMLGLSVFHFISHSIFPLMVYTLCACKVISKLNIKKPAALEGLILSFVCMVRLIWTVSNFVIETFTIMCQIGRSYESCSFLFLTHSVFPFSLLFLQFSTQPFSNPIDSYFILNFSLSTLNNIYSKVFVILAVQ